MTELVPANHVRRCHATRTDGEPCTRWAIQGGTVCPAHGGRAPQVKAAARRRLQRVRLTAEVAELLDELDPDEPQHPAEVLVEQVDRSASMARLLDQLVGMLAPTFDRDRLDERGRILAALWGPNHLEDGAPHTLVALLGEWTERAARLGKMALDADIDLRRQRLAEAEMRRLAEGIKTAKAAARLTPDQEEAFDNALDTAFRGA